MYLVYNSVLCSCQLFFFSAELLSVRFSGEIFVVVFVGRPSLYRKAALYKVDLLFGARDPDVVGFSCGAISFKFIRTFGASFAELHENQTLTFA